MPSHLHGQPVASLAADREPLTGVEIHYSSPRFAAFKTLPFGESLMFQPEEAVLTQLQGRESESQACCERRAGCLATAASTALSV